MTGRNMIDQRRIRERHALLVRLSQMTQQVGSRAGGITSWGETWIAEKTGKQTFDPGMTSQWLIPRWSDPTVPPKQLGFNHMDKIAREKRAQ